MQSTPTPSAGAMVPRMDSGSLPDQARYGSDSMLMKSQRVLHKFFPQSGGTFSPTGSRVIRFDISSPQFLDLSEARFLCEIENTGAGTSLLDGGLGGTIRRVSIMNSSGQLLERIDDYGLIQTVLNQCSDRARLHADDLLISEGFIADATNVGSAATTENRMAAGVTRQYSHKMHGAWFQTAKKKLLPPGMAFRLEIELVPTGNEAMVQTTDVAGAFSMSNVQMVMPAVSIMSQAFEDSTARMLARGYRWSGATYRSYNFSAANAESTKNLQQFNVPDKSLALTGLLAIARVTADTTANQGFKNYKRAAKNFAVDYNVSIGSQQYPPVRIKYETPGAAGAGGDVITGANSFKLAENVEQIKAVLGAAPLSLGDSATMGQVYAIAANGGGTAFLAVQVGYGQGIGIDTQTASLPVQFNCSTAADGGAVPLTVTIFAQATATFSMQPNQGMLEVRSFI